MSEIIKQKDKKYYMNTFGERLDVCFESGKGIKLYADNNEVINTDNIEFLTLSPFIVSTT